MQIVMRYGKSNYEHSKKETTSVIKVIMFVIIFTTFYYNFRNREREKKRQYILELLKL